MLCQNPLCEKQVGEVSTGAWRRTPRRFCSDRCERDVWALKQVAAMLLPLGQSTAWNILQSLRNGGSEDKGQDEIVDPRANVSEV